MSRTAVREPKLQRAEAPAGKTPTPRSSRLGNVRSPTESRAGHSFANVRLQRAPTETAETVESSASPIPEGTVQIAQVETDGTMTMRDVFREGVRERFGPMGLSEAGVDEIVEAIDFLGRDPSQVLAPGTHPVVLSADFVATLRSRLQAQRIDETDRRLGLRPGTTRRLMEWQRREMIRARSEFFEEQARRRRQIQAEKEAQEIEMIKARFRVAGEAVEYAAIISAVSFGLPAAIYLGPEAATAAYVRAMPLVVEEAELAALVLEKYPTLRAAVTMAAAYTEAESIATGEPPGLPHVPKLPKRPKLGSVPGPRHPTVRGPDLGDAGEAIPPVSRPREKGRFVPIKAEPDPRPRSPQSAVPEGGGTKADPDAPVVQPGSKTPTAPAKSAQQLGFESETAWAERNDLTLVRANFAVLDAVSPPVNGVARIGQHKRLSWKKGLNVSPQEIETKVVAQIGETHRKINSDAWRRMVKEFNVTKRGANADKFGFEMPDDWRSSSLSFQMTFRIVARRPPNHVELVQTFHRRFREKFQSSNIFLDVVWALE